MEISKSESDAAAANKLIGMIWIEIDLKSYLNINHNLTSLRSSKKKNQFFSHVVLGSKSVFRRTIYCHLNINETNQPEYSN